MRYWKFNIALFASGVLALLAQPSRAKRIEPVDRQAQQVFARQPKVSVLVGVGNYPASSGLTPLRYAAQDAAALTRVLEGQGYNVVTLKDAEASRAGILRTIRNVKDVLDNEQGTVVFFFSGHGFSVGGVNYIAPVDAEYVSLSRTGISLADIDRQLKDTGAARRVLWIDACRNSPTKDAAGARTFDAFRAAAGTRILFSTKLGKTSYENDDLRSGVFTHFLLEGLKGAASGTDGLITFHDLTEYVTASVRDYSFKRGDVQVPYDGGEAAGDFLLGRSLNPAGGDVAGAPAVAGSPSSVNAQDPGQAEATLWKYIENSTRITDFRGYLDTYPNGVFAPIARRRIAELGANTPKIIPAGTVLSVRTNGYIDSTRVAVPGSQLFGGILEGPIVVGGEVLVPSGAEVTLRLLLEYQSRNGAVNVPGVSAFLQTPAPRAAPQGRGRAANARLEAVSLRVAGKDVSVYATLENDDPLSHPPVRVADGSHLRFILRQTVTI